MTNKGFKTEELLRNYFLRAGFFVVRGIKVQVRGLDLTDADLWIYERSATFARRRTIIDVKDKKRPQAAERMFFVKGLSEVLNVEGAGIVTTDSNSVLRELARKNKILWIDGNDIQRMKTSRHLQAVNRLSEEELIILVDELDKTRGGKVNRSTYELTKSSLGDRFGISSANIALDTFGYFSKEAIKAHPNSESAKTLIRLSYFSASLAAISMDFSSAETALRPIEERIKHMANAIRFGDDQSETDKKMDWLELALNSVEKGSTIYKQVKDKFVSEAEKIPAEALAQIILKYSNSNALFEVARALEAAASNDEVVSFDELPVPAKSFLGALLDFSGHSRERYSAAVNQVSGVSFSEKLQSDGKQFQFFSDGNKN
jgi:hypothetical protein